MKLVKNMANLINALSLISLYLYSMLYEARHGPLVKNVANLINALSLISL